MQCKLATFISAGLLAVSSINASNASDALTSLDVSTNVGNVPVTCSVSATGVAFPWVDGGTDTTANGDVTVNCPLSTKYEILLDGGSNYNANNANNRNESSQNNAYLIPYQLYVDANYTTVWGDNILFLSTGVVGTASGLDQSHTVYGKQFGSQVGLLTSLPNDIYSDIVNVDVQY